MTSPDAPPAIAPPAIAPPAIAPDDAAYLAALAANPDDDAIRLVWADALQARGEPRGELIALQLAEARATAAGDLDAAEIAADAADELLADHADALTPPGVAARLPRRAVRFGRGVVEQVTCSGAELLEIADELFATTPVLDLTLTELVEGEARELAALPGLAQVRTLKLMGDVRRAAPLLASPNLTGLRVLRLTSQSELGTVDVLLRAEALTGVTRLAIDVPGVDLLRLLASTALPALRELDATVDLTAVAGLTAPHRRGRWTSLQLTGDAAQLALAAAPLPALRALVLTTPVGPRGLTDAELPALRQLRLSAHRLDVHEVAALLSAPLARDLDTVGLAGVGLGDPATASVLPRCSLPGLRKLNLASSGLDAAGLRAVLGWNLTGLERLWLGHTRVGDDGVHAIAGARCLGRLRSLGLDDAGVTEPGLHGLASADLPALRELRLRDARLDRATIAALGAAPGLPRLRALRLGGNRLRSPLATAMVGTPLLARLVELELTDAKLHDDTLIALAASPDARGLRVLRLATSSLTSAALLALARSPHLTRLRRLEGRWIVEGAAIPALIAVAGLRHLETLEVAIPFARAEEAALTAALGRRWHGVRIMRWRRP